jgi:hypothetical protein
MAQMTLAQFQKYLDSQPPKLKAAVVRGLRSAAQRGVGVVVEEIDKAEPYPAVNTGSLRQSARAENTEYGAAIVVDAPHAAPINNGTRPFYPPIGPLVVWAMRKFGVTENEAHKIARNVAKKIAEEGIEPRHFFEKAMARMDAIIEAEVGRELQELK